MSTPSVAVVDALNSLLEAEGKSPIRVVEERSPALKGAPEVIRRPVHEMTERTQRHVEELRKLIRRIGGQPLDWRELKPDDPYLSFLSLKFLLPRLANDKEVMIQRYENVLKSLQPTDEVHDTLERQVNEQRRDLAALRKAADEVTKGK